MQKQKYKLIMLVTVLFCVATGCSHKPTFPPVTSIEKFKQTQFVPTLENSMESNKNVIYAPAFLYAWGELKETLNCKVGANDKNTVDLQLVDRAKLFKSALDKGEYETNVSVNGGQVDAEASFSRALPFPSKLQRIDSGIIFDHSHVKAFGMNNHDDKISGFTDIVYYKDDDHFIIRLTPKDTVNTIILVKGIVPGNSLSSAFKQAAGLMVAGEREAAANLNSWKFSFNPQDRFSIPVIKFNIEANYQHIAGQTITCNGAAYHIDMAKQRTAFILDENGAEVESEAHFFASDSVGIPEKAHPKNMSFNKPFLILIGKKRRQNPYFVMWVENAELIEMK
jgi:hypothetical protein